jgi:hypothetical protein
MIQWLQDHSQLLVFVVGLNVFLTCVSQFLDWLQDKTSSDVDNKVNSVLKTVLGWLKTIIDFISANPAH